jgi:hypothetical protein
MKKDSRNKIPPTGGFYKLSFGLLLVAALPFHAVGEEDRVSDVPSGAVAFFARQDGSCPVGFRPAQETAGRLVVGVSGGDAVGKLVGTPLTNQEDRTHVHGFSAAIELPYKSISAANGGNDQGAAAKKYMDSGTSEPAPSGLPFIQLIACVKP